MNKKKNAPRTLSDFECLWNLNRNQWAKVHWRVAAESLEMRARRLEAEIQGDEDPFKRGPGRPRNPVYFNYFFGPPVARKKKRRGRRLINDDAKLRLIYETVESIRDEIELETGSRPTIVAAIRQLAGEWGRSAKIAKYRQDKEVKRWQSLYSKAKAKFQNSAKK